MPDFDLTHITHMDPEEPQTDVTHMDLMTPEGSEGSSTKPCSFKMRLSQKDAALLKSLAHENELSQADFVRLKVFGKTSHQLPCASILQKISHQLAGIANNINQCQRTINEAEKSGTLGPKVCRSMYRAIEAGKKLWDEPLSELRDQIKLMKIRE